MKFCQICGRPLQDNEVCNCQAQRQPAAEDQRTVPGHISSLRLLSLRVLLLLSPSLSLSPATAHSLSSVL